MGIREKAKKVEKLLEKLEERYGRHATYHNDRPIIDQFLFYVLAYENPVTNARKAFRQLTDQGTFVDWNEVRVATLREIEDVLTENRVDRQSAGTLLDLLAQAYQDFNAPSLESLKEEKQERIKRFAASVKGLWPWATTFLLTAVQGDGQVPFDPHTERVATRLKLFEVHDTLTKKKKMLRALAPGREALRMHGLFVEHGKKLCLEESPRCDKCPLTRECDYFSRSKRKATGKRSTSKAKAARETTKSRKKTPARRKTTAKKAAGRKTTSAKGKTPRKKR